MEFHILLVERPPALLEQRHTLVALAVYAEVAARLVERDAEIHGGFVHTSYVSIG